MKHLTLSAVVLAAGIVPAIAADLPVKAPPPAPAPATTWNRCYIGPFAGYGWNITGVNVNLAGTPLDLGSVPHGFMGGGQFGCDKQVSDFLVLGFVADIGVANIRSSGTVGGLLNASDLTNYVGTFNARAGIPIGWHSLVFVEGGLGYAGLKPNFQVGSLQTAASDTSAGWNIAGGLETKLPAMPGWSAFVKGGYMDVGSKALTIDTGGGVLATSSNPLKFGFAKIGLNFAFFGQ